MTDMEKYAIGVDLGGTFIKTGIADRNGNIITKASIETKADEGPAVVIEQIKKSIKLVLKGNERLRIEGIGIGSPGIVSIEEGTVEAPPNLPGWTKVYLGDEIKKAFNIKTVVENDANAAAVGELIFGAGRNFDNFIMITLGTGVGGGIILNKKLFRGEKGGAGELGHIIIDYNGPRCNCGSYGCIETYAGNGYIINRVKNELADKRESKIWKICNYNLEELTPKTISIAAGEGDDYACSVIASIGMYVGIALTSTANLFDTGTFIVGGGVAGFGKPLIDSIEETLRARVMKPLKERIKVVPAQLSNDAGIQGASSLAFYM